MSTEEDALWNEEFRLRMEYQRAVDAYQASLSERDRIVADECLRKLRQARMKRANFYRP